MELPIDFIQRTQALLGDEFEKLRAALRAEAPVSVRINKRKGIAAPRGGEAVAWCDSGFYLPERLTFTFDPLFHAGTYYVQEASSMFLERAIKRYVTEPVRCLDLCAAPGGKSTHLANLLPEGSLLVCNEVIRSRAAVLAENIAKWGRADTVVLNNDPEEIGAAARHLFDVIVADVPCSGEGMFRKDPESVKEWSLENVKLCAARQRRIIHDIWEALKPGGLLIYSTCTYNSEEDEENIHYIIEELGAEALPIPTRVKWNITGALRYDAPCYRFLPHKTQGEGFFLAALRKAPGEVYEARKSKNRREKGKNVPVVPEHIRHFIRKEEERMFEWDDNSLRCYSRSLSEVMSLFKSKPFRPLAIGICIGERKGKDFVPSQELALSANLRQEAFPTAEVEWEDAIRYLRKEMLTLPASVEKGYVLLRYQGFPLGFVKNLGNRANNLYPQEWRIRSGYTPADLRLYQPS